MSRGFIRLTAGAVVTAAAVSFMTTVSPASAADLTIHIQDGDEKTVMYFTPDVMAAVSSEGTMVFDANAESISMKTESGTQVMTKALLKQMSQMASGAGASGMKEQMAQARKMALDAIKQQGLPAEEEAKAIEAMTQQFGQVPGDGASTPTTYKKMGKSKEVSGYQTDGYWITKGGNKTGELWVAGLKELGLAKDDLQVLGKMVQFFEEAAKTIPAMDEEFREFRMMDPNSKDFLGFPISMTDEDGKITLVQSITKGKVDTSIFGIQ